MGAFSFSHIRVTNVKLINEKNYLNITVWMFVNPQKSILLLRLLRSFYNSLHWGCSAYSKVVVACTWSPRTCGATGCGGGEGVITPFPSSSPLFLNLSVFWQNMSVKFPGPMLSLNLEYFIIKNEMQNSINIQCRRNQTFTDDDGF